MNALLLLSDDAERTAGVVTHSSGNHAQALALAGQFWASRSAWSCPGRPRRSSGRRPKATAPDRAVRADPRRPRADRRGQVAEHGYTLIHPFDDWRVIAGQGTAAWELLDQAGPLDVVVCPVGGGGLLAGTALAVKGRSPATKVIGAEPNMADDARRSSQSPERSSPRTTPEPIADGLRTSLGSRPFSVIRTQVDAIVTATEAEILDAMRFVWERFKIIIEPSSAVPVAPVLTGTIARRAGSRSA